MFRSLPAADFGVTDADSVGALHALADKLVATPGGIALHAQRFAHSVLHARGITTTAQASAGRGHRLLVEPVERTRAFCHRRGRTHAQRSRRAANETHI